MRQGEQRLQVLQEGLLGVGAWGLGLELGLELGLGLGLELGLEGWGLGLRFGFGVVVRVFRFGDGAGMPWT